MAFKIRVTSLISSSTNGQDRWPESWIHIARFGPIDRGVSDRRAQCSEDQGIGGNEGTGGSRYTLRANIVPVFLSRTS
jgi:hypothetical protein